MPIVPHSSYRAPWWLPGGHAQTIVPALARIVPPVTRHPERIELTDGDFLDLEWLRNGNKRLVILCHGLEASARAPYIQGMARALANRGWDALAWNYRSCGGELNRLPRFYHSGATTDLAAVVSHALDTHPAETVDLVGFSLGGNLVLKYLGELGAGAVGRIGRAAAFSVPCDLACSSAALDRPLNRAIYMRRFLASLAGKVREKHRQFPERIDPAGLRGIRNFHDFDERYTAPLHGFRDARDYWTRSSSKPFIPAIRVPTLLVNAANDPFLGPACHPRAEAANHPHFHFEMPACGGHVGFPGPPAAESWPERRAADFLGGRPPPA